MSLQETVHNKYLSTVEAPNIEGAHDDMSDALVRMVWLASQHAGAQPAFGRRLGNRVARKQGTQPGGPKRLPSLGGEASARLKSRLGGSHPSRMPGLVGWFGSGRKR